MFYILIFANKRLDLRMRMNFKRLDVGTTGSCGTPMFSSGLQWADNEVDDETQKK